MNSLNTFEVINAQKAVIQLEKTCKGVAKYGEVSHEILVQSDLYHRQSFLPLSFLPKAGHVLKRIIICIQTGKRKSVNFF